MYLNSFYLVFNPGIQNKTYLKRECSPQFSKGYSLTETKHIIIILKKEGLEFNIKQLVQK